MRFFLFSILLLLIDLASDSYSMWNMDTKNSTTIDMSERCVNNLEENVYLPYGMGTADALVLIISNRFNLRRCSMVFSKEILNKNVMKIIVIEFFYDINSNVSSICSDGNLIVTENYVNSIDLCELFNTTQYQNPFIFTTPFDLKFEVKDRRKNKFQAVKITATSTRNLDREEICSSRELTCNLKSMRSCISVDLKCDGNLNCGRRGSADEDRSLCKARSRTSLFFIVLLTTIIVAFFIYSFVYRIKKWSPKLRRHLRMRYINEEDTIVLSSYTPAAKTYIPKKEVKTLHLRVASTTDSSSLSDEGFLQAGFYKIKNQGGNDDSPILHKKGR